MDSKNSKPVLLVEDSPDLQALIIEFLEGEGCNIVYASNGQQALEMLKSMQELPALILLDLMMPVMDGHVFRQEQAKNSRIANIPVIIMTADGHIESKTIKLGAQGFIKKPIDDVENLLDVVKRYSC